MLARFEHSDGLGAIYPPIVWSIVALRAMGYCDESPEVSECLRQLDPLVIEDDRAPGARVQPCKSPVSKSNRSRGCSAAGADPAPTANKVPTMIACQHGSAMAKS